MYLSVMPNSMGAQMTKHTKAVPATPLPWKLSPCKVDGFRVFRIERQTGPCLRADYEFLLGNDGAPIEFNHRMQAEALLREPVESS